eukprot:scaffold81579_cov40-Phaeocystis_antarctica.AAC.1
MVASKKDSRWAQYQSLLVRRPVAMNITQGGIITAAGLAPATLLHRTPQHSTSLHQPHPAPSFRQHPRHPSRRLPPTTGPHTNPTKAASSPRPAASLHR